MTGKSIPATAEKIQAEEKIQTTTEKIQAVEETIRTAVDGNKVQLYLAPLEGITGYVYRNALEKYFSGADRYFTPFIAPDQNKILRTKERRDVLPENNRVPDLVPQILTNNAQHFLQTAQVLKDMGYREVNLNLGCPSATVVSRRRGSGLLAFPQELDRLLGEIFDGTDMKVSVKTRIGSESADEAGMLMEIYRKYPLSELIIHPRTQKQLYRGAADQELFGELLDGFSFPVCYNGDILTQKDYDDLIQKYPQVQRVMIGRGAIADPGLFRQIRTKEATDRKRLRAFHDEVLAGYREAFGEDKNAMFRMKEIWIYMFRLFPDCEKYAKQIKKSQSLAQYICAVDAIFAQQMA